MSRISPTMDNGPYATEGTTGPAYPRGEVMQDVGFGIPLPSGTQKDRTPVEAKLSALNEKLLRLDAVAESLGKGLSTVLQPMETVAGKSLGNTDAPKTAVSVLESVLEGMIEQVEDTTQYLSYIHARLRV